MFYRDLRLFLGNLGAVALLGVLLVVGCLGASAAIIRGETGENITVTLAVTNQDKESSLGTMALELMCGHETIASLARVEIYESRDEALEAVEQGAVAAIIIPDGFFSSVMTGENLPCELILSRNDAVLRDTVKLYGTVGADLLTAAQKAVYGGQMYLKEAGADDETVSRFTMFLNGASLSEAASGKDSYFAEVEISYTAAGLGLEQHYSVLYLVFFLGILGLGFTDFYQKDFQRDTLSRLRACGVGAMKFLYWKLLLPFVMFLFVALFWGAAFQKQIPVSASTVITLAAVALFLSTFSGLMILGLGQGAGGILAAVHLAGLFLMGGVVPYSRLSSLAVQLGRFTPVGATYGLLEGALGGEFRVFDGMWIVGYLFLGILLYLRRRDAVCLGKEGER